LARRAAAESCVLLRNDGVLPLKAGASLAVVGALAESPRYQGAGSSQINPSKLESVTAALAERGITFDYAPGYTLDAAGETPDEALIAAAVAAAEGKDAVLVVAGLPDSSESEGFDRTTLDMPPSHVRLIEAVAAANPRTAVVLQLGSPVVTPWADQVGAILVAYLGGQAGGPGCVDLLVGESAPSGKLAETWPLALADVPSSAWFPGGTKTVEYRESVFVGYRYFDTAGAAVAWPFGHGLSYTTFEYGPVRLGAEAWDGGTLTATVSVTNTGPAAGAEVVQFYVARPDSAIPRPAQELKGFVKVFLTPGESRDVTVEFDRRSFAYWNTAAGAWAVEGGAYEVRVGSSSRDIRGVASLEVTGDGLEEKLAGLKAAAPEYCAVGAPFAVADASFEALLGRPIPPAERVPGEKFTANSTLDDIKGTVMGKIIVGQVVKNAAAMTAGMNDQMKRLVQAMMMDLPLRAIGMMSGGAMTPAMIDGVVDGANGRFLRGLRKLAAGRSKKA
jgi:beta-glucosidase